MSGNGNGWRAVVGCVLAALLLGGCATPYHHDGSARPTRAESHAAAYAAYLEQARTYPAVRLEAAEGTAMTISMAGVGVLEMAGPLPSLSAPVLPESAWASIGRTLGTVAQWAGIAYLGRAYTRGARSTASTTTQSVEVIEVPATPVAPVGGADRPMRGFLNPLGP